MMDEVFAISDPSGFKYETRLALASTGICMHFASKESQVLLTRPFAHLIEQAEQPKNSAFHIYVSHDAPGDEPLRSWQEFERNSTEERQRQLYSQKGQHLLYQHDSKVLTGYDSLTQTAYYYIPKLEMLPFYEKAAPMRMIFHHLAQSKGWSLVHSAAIGLNEKGILLIGAGGSGKTTTALSAALNGFTYLGDDYVLIDPVDKSILSLYQSGKFRWDSGKILAGIEALAVNPRSDKKGYFFLGEAHAALSKSLPFSGILIPRIGGGARTQFRRVPAAKALLFLSASTIFQMPGSGKTTLSNIAKTIQHVPAFEMTLGTHPDEINAQLTELIKGL